MNTLNPQQVAQGLASLGRGRDTMLMHVTPREVAGLQSLALAAGGSLSVNPDTGLPEAGFFDFIADYIVPTALTLSGNPQLAVAYSGGKSYLETGDPMQALLSAGMQYGANQFGSSLMKTGAPSPTTPLGQGIEAGKIAATGGGQAVGVQGAIGTQSGAVPNLVDDVAQSLVADLSRGTTGIPSLQGTPGGAAPVKPIIAPPPSLTDTFSQNLSTAGSGIKNLMGPGGIDKFVDAAGGPGSALFQAGSVAMPAINALTPEPEGAPKRSLGFGDFTPISEIRERYADRMGYAGGGRVYFKEGGEAGQVNENRIIDAIRGIGTKGIQPVFSGISSPLSSGIGAIFSKIANALATRYAREGTLYAQGGIASLNPMIGVFDARNANREFGEQMGGYKKGGYLDGPGDGMSDSIPATIEGRQPARLADGEFVVPADVVSHLGNGSTKAGAQRLYSMMDKVRKARTGRTKQGKQIKADKYLPK